ncbi:MAG: hypothetical protein AAF141_04505 [Pseudomonadota bacterium]
MTAKLDMPNASERAPQVRFADSQRHNVPVAARRNISGMAGWALVAIIAVGVGAGTATMVERPDAMAGTSITAAAMPRPGQNARPTGPITNDLSGIDATLTTAGTRPIEGTSARSTESIRLALSSMQRQINALSSRNDRLEARIRQLQMGVDDAITTGSVRNGNPAQNSNVSATSALQALSAAENDNPSSSLSSGVNDMRQKSQEIAGVDLGSGISFAALRAKWMEIKAARPGELENLEARAVLRDGSQGLIAHLIVGPLSNHEVATRLCESIGQTHTTTCQAVTFEGQPL